VERVHREARCFTDSDITTSRASQENLTLYLVSISAPSPLTKDHSLKEFDCGVGELNAWLKKRALQNQVSNATRTYVASDGDRVIGFHSLAAASVERTLVVSRLQRNTPESIPVILLARLAVDESWQSRGIDGALLLDAARRSLSAAEIIGARALIINAINDRASEFYMRYGFQPSPVASHLLMATIADLHLTFC
jgi:GNAT superfamily N-acetyltransferase